MKKALLTLIVLFSLSALFAQNDTVVLKKNVDTVATPSVPAPLTPVEKPDKPKEKKPPKNKTPLIKRLYFGGGVGATFGTYSSIRINPLIGYKITPKLSVGVQFQYEHLRNKYYSTTFTSDNYGGSLFARFRLIKALYLHAEYAMISFENYYYDDIDQYYSKRELVPFLFLGAGYSQKLIGNSWMNFQILFDVLQNDKSPYRKNEPFYSVGLGVGF